MAMSASMTMPPRSAASIRHRIAVCHCSACTSFAGNAAMYSPASRKVTSSRPLASIGASKRRDQPVQSADLLKIAWSASSSWLVDISPGLMSMKSGALPATFFPNRNVTRDWWFGAIDCKYRRGGIFAKPRICDEAKDTFEQQYQTYYPILESVVRERPNTHLVKSARHFCGSTKCSMLVDGKLMYSDNNHLSINGSKFVAEKIVSEFPELAN
jgi:hypothetical protein